MRLVDLRRQFHRYAESGWTEFATTSFIAETLKALGFEVGVGREVLDVSKVMGRPPEDEINGHIERALSQGASPFWVEKMQRYTGAVAVLDSGMPGPVVALRFDIDANDVVERSTDGHRPFDEGFASVNENAMHACGHDGHAAIGLGLARALSDKLSKTPWTGKLKLIFQPAEEGVRGALAMVAAGVVDDVDYFLAGHIGFGLPLGYFAPRTEGFLATSKLDVTFKGVSAHAGGAPQEGANALLAAASAALNCHAVAPHAKGATRVNVGVLQAGSGRNVIADRALLKIETRGETSDLNQYVYDRVIQVIEGAARMYGVSVEVDDVGMADMATCDEALSGLVQKAAEDLGCFDKIVPVHLLGGSEDAATFMARVSSRGGKATYVTMGTEIAAGHHNEAFDFDESVLEVGVNLYLEVVSKILGVM